MRCITARPSRGDPSSSSCQFSATVCYVHYDCEAWGLGTYLLVGGSRVGSQAVCPSRVCPQPGPLFIVRASPILANATTFGCRYAVLCHGMACSVEREQPTTATQHRSLPASLSFRCQCRCRRAGAHVAGAGASAPASVSMGLPRAEGTSHRTVQQNRSVGNSGGSAR